MLIIILWFDCDTHSKQLKTTPKQQGRKHKSLHPTKLSGDQGGDVTK